MHPDRFFERLDSRIKLRINKPLDGEEIEKMGGKKLETEEDNVVATYVQKESEGKYRCTECTKLFKGEEFVKKHVRLKHPNLLESVKADVDLFNTFVRDPHKMSSNTTTTTSTTTVGGGGNRIDNYQQSSYHQRNSYGGGGASNGGGGYNDRRSGGFAPRGGYNDRRSGGYGGGAPRPPPPRGDAR